MSEPVLPPFESDKERADAWMATSLKQNDRILELIRDRDAAEQRVQSAIASRDGAEKRFLEAIAERDEAKAEHGKTLLLLNTAAFETIPKLEQRVAQLGLELDEARSDVEYLRGAPLLTLPNGLALDRGSIRNGLIQNVQISNDAAGALLGHLESAEAERDQLRERVATLEAQLAQRISDPGWHTAITPTPAKADDDAALAGEGGR